MTREIILANINAWDGKWEPEKGLVFSASGNSAVAIDVKWDSPAITYHAFLMEHAGDDMGAFHFSTAGDFKDFNGLITFVKKVSQYVEYVLEIDNAKIVERPVTDARVEANLAGKVEAYEKILINRDITVGK